MKYLFSFIFWLLCCTVLFAQEDGLNFTRLSVENGLSNNNATFVFQDSKGFIWVGTQDGLNLFDGYQFTHFKHNPKDPKSLSNNIVWAICEDKIGNLWIGTQDGLNRFDRKTYSFSTYKHNKDSLNTTLLNNKIYTLLEDKNGNLWAGTEEGITQFTKERKVFNHFKFPSFYDEGSNATIRNIYEDKKGNILVATYGGGLMIKLPDKKDFTAFPLYPDSLKSEFIQSIYQDSRGAYWIGSIKGIRKIDAKGKFSAFAPYPPYTNDADFNQITSISEDKKGNIWVGTLGGGLVVVPFGNENALKIYTNDFKNPQSISRDLVIHIFTDKAGAIWIATNGGGLSIYDEGRDKFEHLEYEIDNPNSLNNNMINALYEDIGKVLWIGTGGGGLNRLSYENGKKVFKAYKHDPKDKNSISDNFITCIIPSRQGGLWIGTSNGLNYFDRVTSQFQVFRKDLNQEGTIYDDHIISLYEDRDGILWVGTYEGGLNKYNPQTKMFKPYLNSAEFAEHTLSDNMVQAILEDREGFLWVGTGGGGLNQFNKKTEKFFAFKNIPNDTSSLAHNSVKCIFEDKTGTLWVGTHGGLDKFDKEKGTFINFDQHNGLPNNTVHSILEDKKGYLWLSTGTGISHFWIKENEFHNYDQYDNLQSDEFNTAASFKNRAGKMYFGGKRGLNAFYPDSVENNTLKPQIYFTHLRINGKNVDVSSPDSPLQVHISETKKIVLSHEQNTFSVDFVALNYRHSEKNEYQWKLEGHDKDWVKPSKQRFVSYTNLASGTYRLLVRASNNDGVWSEQILSMEIEIEKAIWDTWWFRILLTLLVGGVVFGLYKVRVYQIQAQNKRLEAQVQERTLQISKQKDEILDINKELQSKQEEILAQKQDIIAKNEYLEKANEEILIQRNEIEKSYADIQLISEIGQKITTISHHDFVVETVFDKITSLVNVDMFRIGILDKYTNKIVFQGFSGKERITSYYHDFSTSEGKHLSLWCIENKKEILINDFDQEYKTYIKNGKINTSIKNRPQSVIYLPLLVEEECIGVMTVQSFKKHAYNQEKLNILKTLSIFTSIAIDNYHNFKNLEEAKKEIELNKQKTEDSIRYAETIQKAILPDSHFLKDALGEHFVIFEPQAIVSGDFYWCRQVKDKVFFAVVDCTGHGVPGAFMSIIGSTVLNDVIVQQKIHEPSQILEELHFGVRSALRQDNRINSDGMDVSLCMLEKVNENDEIIPYQSENYAKVKLTYAGAKRPLYYIIDQHLETLDGTKRSIGGGRNVVQKPFLQQTLLLPKGSMIYLATDGYADQNNPEKEKIGSATLKIWLQEIATEDVALQEIKLLTRLIDHMRDENAQRDDITLVGVRV